MKLTSLVKNVSAQNLLAIKAEGVATALGVLTGRTPRVEYLSDATGAYARVYWSDADRTILQERLGPAIDSAARGATQPGTPSVVRVDWGAVVGPVVAARTVPYAGAVALGLFALGYIVGRWR